MSNGYIPYDGRLKQRARDNRKNPTPAESVAWDKIFSNKKFHGYKFSRQKMLGYFIVDFYCSELQLVVEIDGGIHNERIEYDTERTYELEKLGLQVIRFTNEEILGNISQTYDNLNIKLGF